MICRDPISKKSLIDRFHMSMNFEVFKPVPGFFLKKNSNYLGKNILKMQILNTNIPEFLPLWTEIKIKNLHLASIQVTVWVKNTG